MYDPNSPEHKSWIPVDRHSDFPIQNLPFGIFSTPQRPPRPGVAIGDKILDLCETAHLGLLDGIYENRDAFASETLNPIMKGGKAKTRLLRTRISRLLHADNREIAGDTTRTSACIVAQAEAVMHLPVQVGDYTDFYSSKEHATNVGTMFRDPNNALLPNWLYIPVGYHGRASSIVVSGTDIRRPMGQTRPNDQEPPIFGPTRQLDFELETAFLTFDGKPLGERISTGEAEDYIFGMCLFNDWSARDIQKWEYVPLGPFLAKNFASTMSPWIVTLDALESFRTDTPTQSPEPFEYLRFSGQKSYDIHLEMHIRPEGGDDTLVCKTNHKYLYWNMAQQLAHHTVNGCNIRCGDMLASGTISGPTPDSYGSMLELAWKGTRPLHLSDGSERRFIHDGDTVIERGYCEKNGLRVGFGEALGKVVR
jgi:fumarylacetoacetase